MKSTVFFRKKTPPAPSVPPLGLRPLDMDPAPGRYAMWAPSGSETSPIGTPTLALLDEAYALLDTVASYACASVAREVGWVQNTPGTQRVRLPDDLVTRFVEDANGTRLIVSASAEKGVRFHFHEDTPPGVREAFLTQWCAHLRHFHHLVDGGYLRADPVQEERPGAWWDVMKQALTSMTREGSTFEAVGGIHI